MCCSGSYLSPYGASLFHMLIWISLWWGNIFLVQNCADFVQLSTVVSAVNEFLESWVEDCWIEATSFRVNWQSAAVIQCSSEQKNPPSLLLMRMWNAKLTKLWKSRWVIIKNFKKSRIMDICGQKKSAIKRILLCLWKHHPNHHPNLGVFQRRRMVHFRLWDTKILIMYTSDRLRAIWPKPISLLDTGIFFQFIKYVFMRRLFLPTNDYSLRWIFVPLRSCH